MGDFQVGCYTQAKAKVFDAASKWECSVPAAAGLSFIRELVYFSLTAARLAFFVT